MSLFKKKKTTTENAEQPKDMSVKNLEASCCEAIKGNPNVTITYEPYLFSHQEDFLVEIGGLSFSVNLAQKVDMLDIAYEATTLIYGGKEYKIPNRFIWGKSKLSRTLRSAASDQIKAFEEQKRAEGVAKQRAEQENLNAAVEAFRTLTK